MKLSISSFCLLSTALAIAACCQSYGSASATAVSREKTVSEDIGKAGKKKWSDAGYSLVFSERFKRYKPIAFSKNEKTMISRKGYDLTTFRKKVLPEAWQLDYASIPSGADFQTSENGYKIESAGGPIRFMCRHFNSMRNSFVFGLTVKNDSDSESEIILGVHNDAPFKYGHHTLVSEKIPAKTTKTVVANLSVFDQLSRIAPTISVNGSATLVDFMMYRKDHDDFTIVEGEIVARSALPAPKDTDYPDCRYTAHFVGNAILAGMPCNKELVLSIDGFHDKKILWTNSLKVGDKRDHSGKFPSGKNGQHSRSGRFIAFYA